MSEPKTKPTARDVDAFIAKVPEARKRAECATLVSMMEAATGHPPRLWGPSIVGFGSYHYKYASGREGESCLVGFSPRKAAFSIYLDCEGSPELDRQRDSLLQALGRHRMGKGCLYVKRLSDVDPSVLDQLIRLSVANLRQRYPDGSG